jgi:hypothetical protein
MQPEEEIMTESKDRRPERNGEPLLRENDRQKQHLEESLDWLRKEGDYDPSSKNALKADNQVLYELGRFRDDQQREADWMEGFIIRTRKDSLHARLDAADVVRRVRVIEDRVLEFDKRLKWILSIVVFSAVVLALHIASESGRVSWLFP